jgi:poly-gamma-glutamate capsule biosynthesis protein CapA/YwtB (metallophosphatase superfamily)
MKLHIAGDFCPINRAEKLMAGGSSIFSPDFHRFWKEADFRIGNLECPITDATTPIKKSGPPLKAATAIKNGLRALDFDIFSLANNHIMDYGRQGLLDSCSVLREAGIDFFGVRIGEESREICRIEKNNVKVVLMSFSIAEFSLAHDFDNYGAIPIEVIRIVEQIEDNKKDGAHIVILLHVGLDQFPLPTPKQIELSRFLIRRGAAAVLCQHSHICGAYEYYQNGFISYGQGNFVFDLNKKNSHLNEAYVVTLDFNENNMQVQLTGTTQFDSEQRVDLMDEKRQQAQAEKLQRYNDVLASPQLYLAKFKEYIDSNSSKYFGLMTMPYNRWTRAISRRFNVGKLVPVEVKRVWLNLFRNEDHNEVIQEILKRNLQ